MSRRFMMKSWAGLWTVAVLLAFSFTQANAAPCTYSISPTSRTHGNGATNNSVGVSAPLNCTWSVINSNSWITIISPLNNTNSGTVNYLIAANLDPLLPHWSRPYRGTAVCRAPESHQLQLFYFT